MRWIWDDDTLGVEHAAGMILTAPLPIFMILRTLASTQRYTTVRRICEADLTHYLSHLRLPTPRERDALTLRQWFQEDGAPPERRYRFLVDLGGRPRGWDGPEPGWEWWFARAASGGSTRRRTRELDEWEREVVRSEGWQ